MSLPSSGESLTILYVGPLFYGQTCLHRMQTLQKLGHTVTGINTHTEEVKKKASTIMSRIRHKLFFPADHAGMNETLVATVSAQRFDIVWIDKGLIIWPSTLRKVKELQPQVRLVNYSPDDMFNSANQSYYYSKSIPLYDLHVTTKSYNVAEQKKAGAKDVLFVGNAFDPMVHYPMNLTADEKKDLGGPVGFIGAYEKERAEMIIALARAGVSVRIWGNVAWDKLKDQSSLLTIESRHLWGDDYRKALNSFDINLCFLRKANRDLQTTRSIEIPACAAFMLAERTTEHQELFEEGKEAEFFDSREELVQKCRYYLEHPEERKKIAQAGHERCVKAGYDNSSRLRTVIEHLDTH